MAERDIGLEILEGIGEIRQIPSAARLRVGTAPQPLAASVRRKESCVSTI